MNPNPPARNRGSVPVDSEPAAVHEQPLLVLPDPTLPEVPASVAADLDASEPGPPSSTTPASAPESPFPALPASAASALPSSPPSIEASLSTVASGEPASPASRPPSTLPWPPPTPESPGSIGVTLPTNSSVFARTVPKTSAVASANKRVPVGGAGFVAELSTETVNCSTVLPPAAIDGTLQNMFSPKRQPVAGEKLAHVACGEVPVTEVNRGTFASSMKVPVAVLVLRFATWIWYTIDPP